jgi:hypothetical protein
MDGMHKDSQARSARRWTACIKNNPTLFLHLSSCILSPDLYSSKIGVFQSSYAGFWWREGAGIVLLGEGVTLIRIEVKKYIKTIIQQCHMHQNPFFMDLTCSTHNIVSCGYRVLCNSLQGLFSLMVDPWYNEI